MKVIFESTPRYKKAMDLDRNTTAKDETTCDEWFQKLDCNDYWDSVLQKEGKKSANTTLEALGRAHKALQFATATFVSLSIRSIVSV